MNTTDLIVTTITLVVQALIITALAIQNARLQRAIYYRDNIVAQYVRSKRGE